MSDDALTCHRGVTIATTTTSARAARGVAWPPTARASIMAKADALALRAAAGHPDVADLLFVRRRPPGQELALSLRINFEGRSPVMRDLRFRPEPDALDAEGAFTARFLCVHGPEPAEGLEFSWVHTLDVTDATPLGHAPTLDVLAPGCAPVPITLGEGGPPPGKRLQVVELEDALFRTDSAVVMPGGENPEGPGSGAAAPPGAVGVVAVTLRHLAEHPGKKTLVAGHADTKGSAAYNQPLSFERARSGLALLVGDRAEFVARAVARHKTADYQQLLAWAAERLGWPCHPGKVNGIHSDATTRALRAFQQAYNDHDRAGNPEAEPLKVDGALGPKTWGAFFDCYELALREDLGVDRAGLAALRAPLAFVDPARPAVGCGESHPIEGLGKDEFRSQTDRRVEVILFDAGEEPALGCHPTGGTCDAAACEVYATGGYKREHIPLMGSAKAWTARWEGSARRLTPARMVLDAPGLAPGAAIAFEVTREGFGPVGSVQATSATDGASAEWSEWFQPAALGGPRVFAVDEPLPAARFSFTAAGAGRSATSPPLEYADTFALRLTAQGGPLAGRDVVFRAPWGDKLARTDDDGVLRLAGLPPGDGVALLDGRVVLEG